MEFPTLGARCPIQDCKQNDFLPFTCAHCGVVFCKNHYRATDHDCPKYVDNYATGATSNLSYFRCSQESCQDSSPVEIPCIVCKLHYCVSHRYHGCLEMSQEEKLCKLKKWQRPKAEFAIAKTAVDEEIKEALKKTKNVAMANKVQLMRLKGKATGAKTIPTNDRRYFHVYPPKTNCPKAESRAIFVSVEWTIGKVTDTFSKAFNVFGADNTASSPKLRLFHQTTGNLVAEKMDVPMMDLLRDGILTDGQSLILEYSNANEIDPSSYQ